MNAYIDISYIFHLLLIMSSLKLTKIISNNTLTRKKVIVLEITSLILYINVLLFTNQSVIFNTFYYIIIFFLFCKSKFIIALLSFLFSYYSQIAIIRIFTNTIYLYKGVLMLFTPYSFFYILMCPLIILIIQIVTRSIKSLILLKKYRYEIKLTIQNKIYNLSAYFDSGNTLKFKDIPVIFLTNELKDKNIEYERLLIEGIGKETSEYLKGKILFQNEEKDVYCAYVNKKSFNGCKCLLNVYLLG